MELAVEIDGNPRIDGAVGVATPEAQEHDIQARLEIFRRESPDNHVIRVEGKPTYCEDQHNCRESFHDLSALVTR